MQVRSATHAVWKLRSNTSGNNDHNMHLRRTQNVRTARAASVCHVLCMLQHYWLELSRSKHRAGQWAGQVITKRHTLRK
jgi:hypothetical protein